MKPKVLIWYEEATIGFQYAWIDRFASYHDCELQLIDTLGAFPQEPGRLPIAYPTLDGALGSLSDHHWVFLDPGGSIVLDEYKHPTVNNVVYAFGSDRAGFGRDVSSYGDVLRLRNTDEIYVMHALPYVLYDREICLLGCR